MISSGVIVANANRRYLLLLSPAVRFGRIPKREKQRLLDEMQSYMNSLNESASVDMEMSPPTDAPCSPENATSEAAALAPQSCSGSLLNSDEKLLKMAASTSNANAVLFQNGSVQEATISHSATQTQTDNVTSSYPGQSNCPVGHNDNNANPKVDNTKYTFPSNQNQCPFSGVLSPQSNSVSQNSFSTSESRNQSPCPWKLNGGAKVLVRPLSLSARIAACREKGVHRFLMFAVSCRRARSTPVRSRRPADPARRCGTLSPSASPLPSERLWSLPRASQASRVSASTTRSCC